MQADELTHGARRRETVEHLSDHLTAARDRGNRLVVGEVVEDQFDLVVDRRGQQRESLRARVLGRKGRVVSASLARALCIAPITGAESVRGSSRNELGAVESSERPSSHPSRASGRKRCTMPRVAVIGAPE